MGPALSPVALLSFGLVRRRVVVSSGLSDRMTPSCSSHLRRRPPSCKNVRTGSRRRTFPSATGISAPAGGPHDDPQGRSFRTEPATIPRGGCFAPCGAYLQRRHARGNAELDASFRATGVRGGTLATPRPQSARRGWRTLLQPGDAEAEPLEAGAIRRAIASLRPRPTPPAGAIVPPRPTALSRCAERDRVRAASLTMPFALGLSGRALVLRRRQDHAGGSTSPPQAGQPLVLAPGRDPAAPAVGLGPGCRIRRAPRSDSATSISGVMADCPALPRKPRLSRMIAFAIAPPSSGRSFRRRVGGRSFASWSGPSLNSVGMARASALGRRSIRGRMLFAESVARTSRSARGGRTRSCRSASGSFSSRWFTLFGNPDLAALVKHSSSVAELGRASAARLATVPSRRSLSEPGRMQHGRERGEV